MIACTLILMLGVSSYRLQKSRFKSSHQTSLAPPLSNIPKRVIKILSLGHQRLYDDFLYIWLIQFLIPEENVPLEPPDILLKRSRNALQLLPPIEPPYMLSCYVLAFRFQRPQDCEELLLMGIAANPLSWRIPMTLAHVYAFSMDDNITGGHYYEVASKKLGAPAYLASLGRKLKAGENVTEQNSEKILEAIFESETSEQTERNEGHEP